jgi:toxin FitB
VIVLDTNVISALMLDEPDKKIVAWLDRAAPESVWTTTISIFELRYGIELLPAGRRRTHLEREFARVIDTDLQGQVLGFDENAAASAGLIAAVRRQNSHPIEIRDTLIAGIVTSRQADFATRNVRHFEDLDIRLIDPWAD